MGGGKHSTCRAAPLADLAEKASWEVCWPVCVAANQLDIQDSLQAAAALLSPRKPTGLPPDAADQLGDLMARSCYH